MKNTRFQLNPKPYILEIPRYVSGAASIKNNSNNVKLSSNENPAGPSKKAIEAYLNASKQLAIYPDSDQLELRIAIAKIYNLDPERIICGAGSDEIIQFLCYCYAGTGDEVIYTEHGFAMYKISAQAAGAIPVEVSEKSRITDINAIISGCTKNTKLVFIANPNNPTGTMISQEEVFTLAKKLPKHVLLVLDGAYAEYVEDFDAGLACIEKNTNIVMTRTFSKIYGLGALRVGWCYGPKHIINSLMKVRGPFNVSAPAIKAAVAAINDVQYTKKCRELNNYWRTWLAEELSNLEFKSDAAFGNFILVRFNSPEEAVDVYESLLKAGLIVRRVKNYGLPSSLRISIGLEDACKRVVEVLTNFREGN